MRAVPPPQAAITPMKMKQRCDAPASGATTRDGDEPLGVEETTGVGAILPSGGTLDALPMQLGSLSTRELVGPNGTPLIGELPAPADPAGGVSYPYALAGNAKFPSNSAITRAEQRDIESFRA